MRAALIGAVEFNNPHFQSQDFDLVVAVDRGYETCRTHDIAPDMVLGDFDSLGYIPGEGNVKVFPSIKDESDMELALRLVHARGYRDVFVYGALAQRLDHTLANLQVCSSFASHEMHIAGIGTNFAFVALSAGEGNLAQISFDAFDPASLTGEYGPYISVFALAGRAEGVVEQGLKYSLDGAPLTGASSLGLSNEFIGEKACVSVRRGSIVVMFALDALQYAQF